MRGYLGGGEPSQDSFGEGFQGRPVDVHPQAGRLGTVDIPLRVHLQVLHQPEAVVLRGY